jgi:hypothetical protein
MNTLYILQTIIIWFLKILKSYKKIIFLKTTMMKKSENLTLIIKILNSRLKKYSTTSTMFLYFPQFLNKEEDFFIKMSTTFFLHNIIKICFLKEFLNTLLHLLKIIYPTPIITPLLNANNILKINNLILKEKLIL